MKKTYLSRSEAAKKYNVSIAKLRRWEQKGALHRVQTYLTDYPAARAGAPVKWVYDEEELEALTKTSPAVSCVPQNIEAKVFRLLEKGTNGIEIARQTKLPIAEVQRLRAIYVEEVGAMFVSEKIVNKLRKKFILEKPEDFVRIMLWHYEKVSWNARATNHSEATPKTIIMGEGTMPRKLTGTVYEASGKWYARMTIRGQRESILLSTCYDRESAEARTALLAKFAERLREAKREDIVLQLLDHAAALENDKLDDVRRAVDLIVQGKVMRTREGNAPTVHELGERWTSGELAREYPDHVKAKRSAEHDCGRLEMYVYPVIGNIPMDKLTLEHAQLVMRGVPADLASGTRRQVAQLLHRLCAMAVFPMCLRQTNPLPRGFLPKVGPDKAKGWIYPDEEAQLIGSPAVPLEWRMFYGFLHREGTRRSEAGALTWSDIDLVRGVVVLDENKTNDPRAWALSPGVADALRAWRELRARNGEAVGDDARVFVDDEGEPISGRMADQYREHLRMAGITRPVLFEQSKSRQRVRLHDTRATFVTVSLANGKSEAWVQDRTGHKSSTMIAKYRRAARMAAEVGMGGFAKIDVAVGLAGYVREAEGVAVLH